MIRWHLVIHAAIDGFTRLCLYLRCSDNNRACTVRDYFADAVEMLQCAPTRIRTDHGLENSLVWEAMEQHGDGNEQPVVVGASVHNQRVERFNREINRNIRAKYAAIFYDLENNGSLTPDDVYDIFALHYVYIPRINDDLTVLLNSHNHHPIQSEHNRSPLQLLAEHWNLRNDQTGLPAPHTLPTNVISTVSEDKIVISQELYQVLQEQVNPRDDDGQQGRSLYLTVQSYVQACQHF